MLGNKTSRKGNGESSSFSETSERLKRSRSSHPDSTANKPSKLKRTISQHQLYIPQEVFSQENAPSTSLELTFYTLEGSSSLPNFLRAPASDSTPPLSPGWLSEPTTPPSIPTLKNNADESNVIWPGAQPLDDPNFAGPSSSSRSTAHALPNTASSSSSTGEGPHHLNASSDYSIPDSFWAQQPSKPLSPQPSLHTLTPVSSFSSSTGSEQDAEQNLFYASKKLGSRASP